MFPAVDALMKSIRELEAIGKAHMAARIAEMSQMESVVESVDLGESGDFDVFVRGIDG